MKSTVDVVVITDQLSEDGQQIVKYRSGRQVGEVENTLLAESKYNLNIIGYVTTDEEFAKMEMEGQ